MDQHTNYQLEFLQACAENDIERAKLLLRSGHVDVNFHHRVNGWTALHWASRRGHKEIVDVLIEAGFDPCAITKDGKTPAEVATEESIRQYILKFINPMPKLNDEVLTAEMKSVNELFSENENGNEKTLPECKQGSSSRTLVKMKSFDSNSASQPESPTTPTRQEIYHYGRRDSLNRTRFLLVRISAGHGKETFKRVTLPGGGTVDFLKLTIERAMKMGKVVQVVTLPDRIPIETEDQIRNLADSQKVEVVFEPFDDEDLKGVRKSVTEKTRSEVNPYQARTPRLQKKAISMVEEYFGNSNGNTGANNIDDDKINKMNQDVPEERVYNHDSIDQSTDSSSLSSALEPEIEEMTSLNSSLSASSSSGKARTVILRGQQESNNIRIAAPDKSKNFKKAKQLSEEVSCDYTLENAKAESESVDLSFSQVEDAAVAKDLLYSNYSNGKVLGEMEDLEELNKEIEKHRKYERKLKIAVMSVAGIACVGGIVYYCYWRSK